MLVEHLLNFSLLVTIQLLFFIFHAYVARELKNILFYLGRGMLLGLPFGVLFDLIIGKGLGMFEYELGFTFWCLVINGIFSYGFMIANVFLLKNHSWQDVYLWSVGLGTVYEVTNYFLPVWKWTFGTLAFEYGLVVLVAYTGLTVLMMTCMQILYRFNFRIISY